MKNTERLALLFGLGNLLTAASQLRALVGPAAILAGIPACAQFPMAPSGAKRKRLEPAQQVRDVGIHPYRSVRHNSGPTGPCSEDSQAALQRANAAGRKPGRPPARTLEWQRPEGLGNPPSHLVAAQYSCFMLTSYSGRFCSTTTPQWLNLSPPLTATHSPSPSGVSPGPALRHVSWWRAEPQ